MQCASIGGFSGSREQHAFAHSICIRMNGSYRNPDRTFLRIEYQDDDKTHLMSCCETHRLAFLLCTDCWVLQGQEELSLRQSLLNLRNRSDTSVQGVLSVVTEHLAASWAY